jgi:hypothetical protein
VELCWGRDIEATEPALVLLIQWAGVSAWKNVQESPGVSLITGMLRRNPLNRMVQRHPEYLYGPERIIEIVFLSVGSGAEATAIEADLIHLHAVAARKGEVDCYTHAAERYVSTPSLPPARKERASCQM